MLVSFKAQRIQTSANTSITPAHIVGARLISTTSAAVTVHLHDIVSGGTTSASTRIGTLYTSNKGLDEIGYPLRVGGGTLVVTPVVSAGGTTATVYVFVR